jgi:hypothetical protein
MVEFRELAQKAKENHFGIGLKAMTFLLAFMGVVFSVVGSLTCQFLGYHHSSTTIDADIAAASIDVWSTSLSPSTDSSITTNLAWEGSTTKESWLGLFSYDPIETTTNITIHTTTQTCIVYPQDVIFGNKKDTPFPLLRWSQISAVVAPTLGLISIMIFVLHFAQQQQQKQTQQKHKIYCRSEDVYPIVSFMLLTAAGIQACTFLIFREPSFWYVTYSWVSTRLSTLIV